MLCFSKQEIADWCLLRFPLEDKTLEQNWHEKLILSLYSNFQALDHFSVKTRTEKELGGKLYLE